MHACYASGCKAVSMASVTACGGRKMFCGGALSSACAVCLVVAAAALQAREGYFVSDPRLRSSKLYSSASASASGGGGFAGDARVPLSDGRTVAMRDLAVGDKVVVLGPDGFIACDEVYAFQHREPSIQERFLKVSTSAQPEGATETAVVVKQSHMLFSVPGDEGAPFGFTKATRIQYGDRLMMANPTSLETKPVYVTGISVVYSTGLFSPLTKMGNLVIDGIVASVNSEPLLPATT